MAICLPGMASRVKRAATSAIRPEPLVMTMKLISTMIMKMMKPTMKSPPTTKLPKEWITRPTAPGPSWPWRRISRVEAMLRERRKRVVTRSSDGKEEKSSGLVLYIDISRMTRPMVMLSDSSRSRIMVGRGRIMTIRMATTPTATKRLEPSSLTALKPVAAAVFSSAITVCRFWKKFTASAEDPFRALKKLKAALPTPSCSGRCTRRPGFPPRPGRGSREWIR